MPGGGYYLQLEDADEQQPGWRGRRIVGGVGQAEFDLIGRGVRTETFTIGPAQPEVYSCTNGWVCGWGCVCEQSGKQAGPAQTTSTQWNNKDFRVPSVRRFLL